MRELETASGVLCDLQVPLQLKGHFIRWQFNLDCYMELNLGLQRKDAKTEYMNLRCACDASVSGLNSNG